MERIPFEGISSKAYATERISNTDMRISRLLEMH